MLSSVAASPVPAVSAVLSVGCWDAVSVWLSAGSCSTEDSVSLSEGSSSVADSDSLSEEVSSVEDSDSLSEEVSSVADSVSFPEALSFVLSVSEADSCSLSVCFSVVSCSEAVSDGCCESGSGSFPPEVCSFSGCSAGVLSAAACTAAGFYRLHNRFCCRGRQYIYYRFHAGRQRHFRI